MPTISSTRYTDYKKKFHRELQKFGSSVTDTSNDLVKAFLSKENSQNLENFKLPYLKPPSTFPARPKRRISERREFCVNPFPKHGSGEYNGCSSNKSQADTGQPVSKSLNTLQCFNYVVTVLHNYWFQKLHDWVLKTLAYIYCYFKTCQSVH